MATPTSPEKNTATLTPTKSTSEVTLSQNVPSLRITNILLNGQNFPAWSRSVKLFLGGRGKEDWLSGTVTKPVSTDPKFAQWRVDNCTILGWLFNSMDDRIYNMFMYHDTVHGLWKSLTQMYAHERNESRIFELYREISHTSQASLGLSVADFFGYLQSRWEELAQYEPLSDFPSETASIVVTRLNKQHTYQFLMGLKPDFIIGSFLDCRDPFLGLSTRCRY